MNIFVILWTFFWVGMLAVLGLCLVALLVTACARKSWKYALWSVVGTVGAAVLGTGLLLGVYAWFFRPYDPTSEAELGKAYQADFSSLPPPGITVLKARQVIVGDSGGQWLLLKASPEEIDRHIAMGFKTPETTPDEFRREAGGNVPPWWQPSADLEIYENRDWSKDGGWHSSRAAIGVDRRASLIWFVASKH